MKAKGFIDIIGRLKQMENVGIIKPITAEQMRPNLESDLKKMVKLFDERILKELEKSLKQ